MGEEGRVKDVPLVGVVGLFLHHLQDALAGVGAVLRIAIDSDRFLQGSCIVLPVDVNSCPRL